MNLTTTNNLKTRTTPMKKTVLLATLLVAWAADNACGGLETFNSGSEVGTIPDGNPVGAAFVGSVSDLTAGTTVGGLTVGLNISGGYDGDLYAYLVAPNGTLVVLLNQPGVSGANGFGASGAGMNITLQDGAGTQGSIQSVMSSSVLSGTNNAANSLASINGSVADGNWTLYFADLSSGGGTSILNSWSLGITAVPEPVNMALTVFGVVLVGAGIARWCLRRSTASIKRTDAA